MSPKLCRWYRTCTSLFSEYVAGDSGFGAKYPDSAVPMNHQTRASFCGCYPLSCSIEGRKAYSTSGRCFSQRHFRPSKILLSSGRGQSGFILAQRRTRGSLRDCCPCMLRQSSCAVLASRWAIMCCRDWSVHLSLCDELRRRAKIKCALSVHALRIYRVNESTKPRTVLSEQRGAQPPACARHPIDEWPRHGA